MASKRLPDTLNKTIVIAGGTGLVARSLKYAFESIGCNVIAISRHGLPDSITWDQLRTGGLPVQTSAVINCCGKSIFAPAPFNQSLKNEIYESRIGTNLLLRDAIIKAKNKPKAFITMSGVACYKADPSIVHYEDSKELNDDYWANLIKNWEGATVLPKSCETRRVMIRTGVVLSTHGGMIKNMWPSFKLGFGGPIGSGDQYMPIIHIKDLLKLIVFCTEITEIEGVVNAATPNFCTMKELTETLARAMRRPHFASIPEWLIKRLVAKERLDILLSSVKVYPKKALDHQFEFTYPDVYSSMAGLVDLKY